MSAPLRILQLRHMPDPAHDRVSAFLQRRGCVLVQCTPAAGDALPDSDAYDAVVVYGGVQSANDTDKAPYIRHEIEWIRRWVDDGRPYFGICLGGQLLARAMGATVAHHADGDELREIGFATVRPTAEGRSFLPATLPFYQWHGEGFSVPAGATLLATGDTFPHQAFRCGECAFGVQFHPEVTLNIIRSWQQEAANELLRPGAHSPERQLTDWKRMNRDMETWLHNFLRSWLASGGDD